MVFSQAAMNGASLPKYLICGENIMVNGHVHSIKFDDKYHHLFNLSFMNADEISVIQSLLNGQAVEQTKLPALNAVKKSVEEIINMAIVKDTQPAAERIDFAAERIDFAVLQDAKDAEAEVVDE
jgi:hypothetical protein